MAVAAEQVFEFLAEDEEEQMAENPVQIDKAKEWSISIMFNLAIHLIKSLFKIFTSHVDPGRTVAIVGPTGAGKTTMVKLLMRFYDVNSGAIKIDGHNIKDFNRADLRKNIGMVFAGCVVVQRDDHGQLAVRSFRCDRRKFTQQLKPLTWITSSRHCLVAMTWN